MSKMKKERTKPNSVTNEVIFKASQLPFVKVNREEFLRKTFKGDPNIEDIIAKGPQAVYTVESLNKKSIALINGTTKQTAVASFLSGLPSNPAVAVAAAGIDITQYFGFSINLAQKISYLFGADDFENLSSEEAQTKIIVLVGTMFGIETAKNTLARTVVTAGRTIGKRVSAKPLTKTAWYPITKKILNEIGIHITKDSVKDVIAKSFSVIGAFISGGLTWVSFRPLGHNLTNVYVDILNGKYDVEMVLRDDFIPLNDEIIDVEFEEVGSNEIKEDSEYVIQLNLDEETSKQMVWIGDNGACYHLNDNCVTLLNIRFVELSEAEALGKRRCKKCGY